MLIWLTNKMKICLLFALALVLSGCYGINSETSEIGSIEALCLDSKAWPKICEEHSPNNISNEEWLLKVEDVKEHFSKPTYILYFMEDPQEIIGCDAYSVRVVYNPELVDQVLTGLSPLLGNSEQKRIRNRVLSEIMKYQCQDGKAKTLANMKKDVPYSESHKAYPLSATPEMEAAEPE